MFFISNKTYNNLLDFEDILNLSDCFFNIKKTNDFTSEFFNKKDNYLIINVSR